MMLLYASKVINGLRDYYKYYSYIPTPRSSPDILIHGTKSETSDNDIQLITAALVSRKRVVYLKWLNGSASCRTKIVQTGKHSMKVTAVALHEPVKRIRYFAVKGEVVIPYTFTVVFDVVRDKNTLLVRYNCLT